MPVKRHVDPGTVATGQLSAFGVGVGKRAARKPRWAAVECAGGGKASMRAVPLQARALDALDRIKDSNGSPLLLPGKRGGYLDIHDFRPFQWRPAQKAAGIDPLRRVYDLRHTFATFALRAGISTFDLGCPICDRLPPVAPAWLH